MIITPYVKGTVYHPAIPAKSMLNCLDAFLFAETRFGLLRACFDPMACVIHADNQYRDSFAYDVMEAVRPNVDVWVVEFVQGHKFTIKDF